VQNIQTNLPNWYLLYTAPRAEKKTQLELNKKGYKTFLPLQKTLKKWSDRKKWVESPLFNGYIFIETILEKNYTNILNTKGVVRFVSFGNKPVIVMQRELNLIEKILGFAENLEVTSEIFTLGQKVEVTSGTLMGTKGILVQKNGKKHFMIEIESISQKVLLNIPLKMLKASDKISPI
jgi:transcription elongation factor/antiterminator RfaH